MSGTVGVCTESVACVPADDAAALGIEIVPLPVQFGLDTYRDGLELEPDEFYARMATDPELPTTAAPSVGEYLAACEQLAIRGHAEIVIVTLSARLSTAAQSARLAAERAPVPVHVVDAGTAAAPQGLLARAAARAATEGATAGMVVDTLERLKPHTGLLAVVPTLRYLRRGGRVGRLAGLAGEQLRIKPLATLVDGEARSAGIVRSLEHAYDRMVHRLSELASDSETLEVAVMQADAASAARALADRIASDVAPASLDVVAFTPVMGAHTGPGVVGVGWLAPPAR